MSLRFRTAVRADVPALVQMLADDELGATREDTTGPLSDSYDSAFSAIDADPNNQIIIAESGNSIAGFLQLTFIPYLTYRGSWRAQIEGVRVSSDQRGKGVGAALIEYAVDKAREHDCHLVQLTTDRRRPEALRFYERMGFKASHAGLKLPL